MGQYIERVAYYCSCMVLFNFIFILKMITDGLCGNGGSIEKLQCDINCITFFFCVFMLITGIICTILIIKTDLKIPEKSLGKIITVVDVKELTTDNYFTNFSLLVLTGLSIPSNKGLGSILIYLSIVISLGIVYVKKNAYYINPILTLYNYNVFQCKNQDNSKEYILVTQNRIIKEGERLNIPNVNSKIIRIS